MMNKLNEIKKIDLNINELEIEEVMFLIKKNTRGLLEYSASNCSLRFPASNENPDVFIH